MKALWELQGHQSDDHIVLSRTDLTDVPHVQLHRTRTQKGLALALSTLLSVSRDSAFLNQGAPNVHFTLIHK